MIAGLASLKSYRVQTWLGQKATAMLSDKLNTKVTVDRVELDFFNKAHFHQFFMADSTGDTLVYVGDLTLRLNLVSLTTKTIKAKSLILNDGVFHIKKDSIYGVNMGYIIRRLSGAPKDTSTTAKTKDPWKFDIGGLELNNIDFAYLDDKSKTYLRVYVPECRIGVNQLALDKQTINLGKVKLADATVTLDMYPHWKDPADTTRKPIHFLPGNFKILFDELDISHTSFRLDNHKIDTITRNGMDFRHLLITGIDINMKRGGVASDTIFADIQNLNAKDRSGLNVLALRSKTLVSVNEITCKDLYIKTPDSEIKDYFQLTFTDIRDFKYFVTKVRINSHLDNSTLAIKDLGYFIKKLDKIAHNKVKISGDVKGRINDLSAKNIDIRMASGTVLKGDFFTTGLPNIFETSINMRVKTLSTNVGDVQRILPAVKLPGNLYSLGNLSFNGSLDGFVTDFVATGNFNSAIGSAKTDLNFKYDKERGKSAYAGNLALNSFDLGKFFADEKNLGKVTLSAKVDGGGLTLESLRAELEGNINSIVLKNYEYKDILVDGLVKKKSFNGWLTVRDKNLDMDFTGFIDISDSMPKFNFEANVFNACLKELNLVPQNYCIAGKLNADLMGNKVDNLQGELSLKNFDVSKDTLKAHVNSALLTSSFTGNDNRRIALESDFAEGEINGKFTYGALWKSLKNFFNYTLTRDYVPDSLNREQPQNFTLALNIYEPGSITKMISPDFKLIRNSKIEGSFNSVNHSLVAEAYVPELIYGNFRVLATDVNINAADGKFDFVAEVDRVYSKDSILLDTLQFLANSPGGDFRFDILAAGKNFNNYANATAFLTPLRGMAELRLEPGEFKLGKNLWHFGPDNSILIAGKKIVTDDLVFQTSDQMLFIDAYLKNDTSTSVKLTLNNTSISDFTGIFTNKVKEIKGSVNGKLTVEDIFYKPKVYANFVAEELTLGNELLGDLDVNSTLDSSNQRVIIDASLKGGNNFILVDGNVLLNKGNPSINLDVRAPSIGLGFLNFSFFEKFVDSVSGTASAKLHMEGPVSRPVLTGNVRVNYADLIVSYLGTRYSLKEQNVTVKDGLFDLEKVVIQDRAGNLARIEYGGILHDHFKKFALNFNVRSLSDDFQFLNTTEKQNPTFYGQAYGRASVTFKGPLNSPDITAEARTGKGTHVYLPIRSTYEVNRYGFYRFVNPVADSVVLPAQPLKLNGVSFTLNMEATPDAQMDIILDPISGDKLTARGYGNLKIAIPKTGNISMVGNYEIESGKYIFTLQDIISKNFIIAKGSSVSFAGDIYKARLNVDAAYTVTTSMFALINDLIRSQGSSGQSENQLQTLARSRIPVNLYLKMTGVLDNPNIAFDIKPVDPNPVIKSYVDQKINLLKANDNEMNKQVFGLLVMNQFIEADQTTTSAIGNSNLGGTAANTVSEFVSAQFSNYFNDFLSQFLKDNSLDFSLAYRQYDQLSESEQNSFNQTRRELQLALSTSLLNNRLTISAGGNIDFGGTGNTTNPNPTSGKGVIPTGNFQIEYALTKDGALRAKAFNRVDYDYLNARNLNRTGMGLSYRVEFDNIADLREIFRQRRREREQRKEEKALKRQEEALINSETKESKKKAKGKK